MSHSPATSDIRYPYIPKQGKIVYVTASNKYIQIAKKYATKHSLDRTMPNASVIVKDGEILGVGANGSTYHEINGCERVKLNSPTGKDYDKCEGCHPKNHSEAKAILNSQTQLQDAEIYLWGHWWCCKSCWAVMLENGISKVHLLSNSSSLFNKDSPDNIIGKQLSSSIE